MTTSQPAYTLSDSPSDAICDSNNASASHQNAAVTNVDNGLTKFINGCLKMSQAFLICGTQSSGNRFLVRIFLAAGCAGKAHFNQPEIPEDVPLRENYVTFRHHYIPKWVDMLKRSGYDRVTCVLPIREPWANIQSQLLRGHYRRFHEAYRFRSQVIAQNARDAILVADRLEIVSVEGITQPFLEQWLPLLGLKWNPECPVWIDMNSKHYTNTKKSR